MSESKCTLCGESMPPGEEMFKYHGYSGPCPKPPLPKDSVKEAVDRITDALRPFKISDCRIALRRALTALGEQTIDLCPKCNQNPTSVGRGDGCLDIYCPYRTSEAGRK